jgi:hypothetical protein
MFRIVRVPLTLEKFFRALKPCFHFLALRPGMGVTLYLVIDDSKKAKQGPHLDAVPR